MPIAFEDHLAHVRATIAHTTATALADALTRSPAPLVIDIREPEERAAGFIPGSIAIPRAFLEARIAGVATTAGRAMIICCESGVRSALAVDALNRLGWPDVANLEGGCEAWRAAGLAWTVADTLTPVDRARYARQLRLPEVGDAGQRRLGDARVLVVGAGGLGSPVLLYLAAAGVGTLGIVDNDRVDVSNLHRQILHDTASIGLPKAQSAANRLYALNPGVRTVVISERLTSANISNITTKWDIVVDSTDNFATRYLINAACIEHGIPNVHGSIHRFDGQVAVFGHDGGPCYRCLHPEPPPADLAPNCADAGVLGAACGVVGSLMAAETLKLLLRMGGPLSGRLLVLDLRTQTMRTLKIARNSACPTCGDTDFRRLIETFETCDGAP